MKRLFLHFGLPKTGTTTIQEWFTNNENISSKNNIYYPTYNGSRDHNFIFDRPDMISNILSGKTDLKQLDGLIQNIKKSDNEDILISAENIFYLSNFELNSLFSLLEDSLSSRYKIIIVKVKRDFIQWSESLYFQFLKMGVFSGSFKSFIEEFQIKSLYLNFFNFKKGSSIIIDYEDQLSDNLVSNFIMNVFNKRINVENKFHNKRPFPEWKMLNLRIFNKLLNRKFKYDRKRYEIMLRYKLLRNGKFSRTIHGVIYPLSYILFRLHKHEINEVRKELLNSKSRNA